MAEFCLDCFNRICGTDYKRGDVNLDEDFCEGCAQWKPCIVSLKGPHRFFGGDDTPRKKQKKKRRT